MSGDSLAAADILAVLIRHGVEFVVIDAFAAIAQGAPLAATEDIDVTPSRELANLDRLSNALDELDARIRTSDNEQGLPFVHDGASLGRMETLNLTCASGDFDIVFAPAAAPRGYNDLVEDAVLIAVGETQVRAASVEDIVRSKEAAGRAKDLRVLPALREFVRRQQQQE